MYAALLVTALLACWQALTVRYTYGGNWTALFCSGTYFKDPSPVLHENVYRFPDSYGYDGQFYHLIAHDPWLARHLEPYMDTAQYRYARILIPGLAYLLAFGQDRFVDAAYIVVILLTIFAGTYWFGRYAGTWGYSGWFGILFAGAPAVVISVDRLTIDVALAALCAGFALYTAESSARKLYALLLAAPLVRELGLLLVGAWCIWLAARRRWRETLFFATAVIPFVCWRLFLGMQTTPDQKTFFTWIPFTGLFTRMLHPFPYAFSGPVWLAAVAFDVMALVGIAAAIAWAVGRACVRAWSPVAIALYLFAWMTIFLSNADVWVEVYSFGRTLTPVVLLAALDGLSVSSFAPAVAMLLLEPRIGLQLGGQILNVARGLFR